MPSVTQYYGIDAAVPFVDVDVDVDTELFIDPHQVRLEGRPQPFADRANQCTQTFFGEIARCVMSDDERDTQRGLDLLQHFVEPWETRLGLASGGFFGHGGAEDVGAWIWDAMSSDLEVLLRVGLLTQIEDLPLFVDGIDRDITSDLTTRIIFEPLADFTEHMVESFPQFSSGTHTIQKYDRQVWDCDNLRWGSKVVQLPVADGKPLLLVPDRWARRNLLMSAERFYETSVLSYAQLEQAVVSRATGKLIKSPKDTLKRQAELRRGRITNLAVTTWAHTKGDDLLRLFRHFVDSKYRRAA